MSAVADAVKSGDSEAFFKAMKDDPEYSTLMTATEKALASGDSNLKNWATKARDALKKQFDIKGLQLSGGSETDMLTGILKAIGMMINGDFKGGFSALMTAFNGAAAGPDPAKLAQLNKEKQEALDAAGKSLAASTSADKPTGDLLPQAVTKIDAMRPA